jgi:hypothetical protein
VCGNRILRRIFGPKKKKVGMLQEDEANDILRSFITFPIMNLVGSYPFLYWHHSFTVQNLCRRISVKKSGFYSSSIFYETNALFVIS